MSSLKIGLVTSSSDESKLLAELLQEKGCKLVFNIAPEDIHEEHVKAQDLHVWLLNIDDDSWHDSVDLLLDESETPVFFSEPGVLNKQSHPEYWCSKLIDRLYELTGFKPQASSPEDKSPDQPELLSEPEPQSTRLPACETSFDTTEAGDTVIEKVLPETSMQSDDEDSESLDDSLEMLEASSLELPDDIAAELVSELESISPVLKQDSQFSLEDDLEKEIAVDDELSIELDNGESFELETLDAELQIESTELEIEEPSNQQRVDSEQIALDENSPKEGGAETQAEEPESLDDAVDVDATLELDHEPENSSEFELTLEPIEEKAAPDWLNMKTTQVEEPVELEADEPIESIPLTEEEVSLEELDEQQTPPQAEDSEALQVDSSDVLTLEAAEEKALPDWLNTETTPAEELTELEADEFIESIPLVEEEVSLEEDFSLEGVSLEKEFSLEEQTTTQAPIESLLDDTELALEGLQEGSNSDGSVALCEQGKSDLLQELSEPEEDLSFALDDEDKAELMAELSLDVLDDGLESELEDEISLEKETQSAVGADLDTVEVEQEFDEPSADSEPEAEIAQQTDETFEIPMLEEAASGIDFEEEQAEQNVRRHPCWVLGASLGGPAAVKRFLQHIPKDIQASFIIAQHIDENFLPVLAEILTSSSEFEVTVASGSNEMAAGSILLAPLKGKTIFLQDGSMLVDHSQKWSEPYSPCIDDVIQAVSQVYGDTAGAIIFSGMGQDGLTGASKMRQQGGQVWAQSVDTCANASMPEALINSEEVDFVGSPEELAEKLTDFLAE